MLRRSASEHGDPIVDLFVRAGAASPATLSLAFSSRRSIVDHANDLREDSRWAYATTTGDRSHEPRTRRLDIV